MMMATDRKGDLNMKKTLALGLSLCLLLSGCTPFSEQNSVGDPDTSADAIAVQLAEEKAAYYRQLAAELQEELIAVRAEYYERYEAYEERIAKLEAQIENQGSTDDEGGDTDTLEKEESDFQFRVEDGAATLIAYTGKNAMVEIPTSFEGYPVIAIGDRAFENCIQLEGVTIPDGTLTVGWFAFSGCIRLETVRIPDSVRSISYGAFLNCNSKMTVACSADSYAAAYARSYGIEVKSQ